MRVGKRTTAGSKNGEKELTFKIKKASNLKGRLRINSHRPKDRRRLGKKLEKAQRKNSKRFIKETTDH